MIARIYFFSSSLKAPAISWFPSTNNPKHNVLFSEMQRSTVFKNLFYSDFPESSLEFLLHNESVRLRFEISDFYNNTVLKECREIEKIGVFCFFRKTLFEIRNHEHLKEKDSKSLVFFTDLDDTLFGNEEYLQEFYEFWIQNCLFDSRKQLIYTTGRSFLTFSGLEAKMELFYPEYLICSNGTEIYHFDGTTNQYKLDLEWDQHIMRNWNSDAVLKEFQQLNWLIPNYKSPHDSKSLRFFVDYIDLEERKTELLVLEEKLAKKGFLISFYYSGHEQMRMLDVTSKLSGKGNASLYLMKKLNVKWENTFGFGDSHNDLDLIQKCGKGILVANSQKELLTIFKKKQHENGNVAISEYSYAKALLMELKKILFKE